MVHMRIVALVLESESAFREEGLLGVLLDPMLLVLAGDRDHCRLLARVDDHASARNQCRGCSTRIYGPFYLHSNA